MKFITILSFLLSCSGCLSAQNHPSLEALEQMKGVSPLVEGYIEYGGPEERWMGPSSLMIHVLAKEGTLAQITVSGPNFVEPIEMPPTPARTLASSGMSVEMARDHLKNLAGAIAQDESPFQGCLSPLRVRMIHANGAVEEKQGCRSQKGWPGLTNQIASQMMAVASSTAAPNAFSEKTPEGSTQAPDRIPAGIEPKK